MSRVVQFRTVVPFRIGCAIHHRRAHSIPEGELRCGPSGVRWGPGGEEKVIKKTGEKGRAWRRRSTPLLAPIFALFRSLACRYIDRSSEA